MRSGIEIGRILEAMREDEDALTANLQAEVLFISRLIEVQTQAGAMLLAYADHKPANTAVLAAPSVTFRCNHRGAQYAFSGTQARHAAHADRPAIRFAFPAAMLAMQQRRLNPRLKVPAQAQLVCELRVGTLSFDARVLDISLDGLGTLVYVGPVHLLAGMRLERARIRCPLREPALVDLEVRHVGRISLADGRRATRVGCRILGSPKDMDDLVRQFVVDLA